MNMSTLDEVYIEEEISWGYGWCHPRAALFLS